MRRGCIRDLIVLRLPFYLFFYHSLVTAKDHVVRSRLKSIFKANYWSLSGCRTSPDVVMFRRKKYGTCKLAGCAQAQPLENTGLTTQGEGSILFSASVAGSFDVEPRRRDEQTEPRAHLDIIGTIREPEHFSMGKFSILSLFASYFTFILQLVEVFSYEKGVPKILFACRP